MWYYRLTFDGNTGAAFTVPQLYAIENKILHDIDDSDLGYVSVKANTSSVTQTSFSNPATTTPSIQRGIDAWGSAGTVNVEGSDPPLPPAEWMQPVKMLR